MELKAFFETHKKVAIACSGGVDSTFLVYQAKKYADEVRAYFVKSPFQPAFELEDARVCCDRAGVELRVIEVDVLSCKQIVENPADRCYYCKRAIFEALWQAARKDGFDVLLEGTNASDDVNDRPGMRALQELSVLSPLRICGYTKAMIRKQAGQEGISTHAKPAYACLATRIPQGNRITAELLAKVEESEKALFALGFHDFRVRVFHEAARLQLKTEELPMLLEKRQEVVKALQTYFDEVFLDIAVER